MQKQTTIKSRKGKNNFLNNKNETAKKKKSKQTHKFNIVAWYKITIFFSRRYLLDLLNLIFDISRCC